MGFSFILFSDTNTDTDINSACRKARGELLLGFFKQFVGFCIYSLFRRYLNSLIIKPKIFSSESTNIYQSRFFFSGVINSQYLPTSSGFHNKAVVFILITA